MLTQQHESALRGEPRYKYTADRNYYKVKQNLTSIPTDIPADALEVHLEYKSITKIEADVFSELSQCEHLFLYNNQICDIEPEAFKGLGSLTWLSFRSNQLTELELGTFDGLSNLTELHLGFNQISELTPGIFDGLSALSTLRLNYNKLQRLSPLLFCGLNSLCRLSLNENRLTRLSADVFNHLPRPLELALFDAYFYYRSDGPEKYVCDSELCWLKKEEQQGNITWTRIGSGGPPSICGNGLDWDTWDCDETGDVFLIS